MRFASTVARRGIALAQEPWEPPMIRLRRTADVTLADATWTAIEWQSVVSGYGIHWREQDPEHVYLFLPGEYQYTLSGRFAVNGTGARGLRLRRREADASYTAVNQKVVPTVATVKWSDEISGQLRIQGGLRIQCQAYQTSGGNLAFDATIDEAPRLEIVYVRGLTR